MENRVKYRFSFTAASLMYADLVHFAKLMVVDGYSLEKLKPELLSRNREKTNKREFAELFLRLKTLTEKELLLLTNGNIEVQKLICLVAFARAYRFFRDFVEEVVQEKILLFDFKISDLDYYSFVNRKAIDHEELDQLAPSTRGKVKQVIFKVLHQAGLIDNIKDRNIVIPIVDLQLSETILETNPRDLKILLYNLP
jgi:hypothetical protein